MKTHMKTMLTFTALAFVVTAAIVSPARAQQTRDIVDTAVAAGSLKTLARALAAADLVGTLKGPGPFTVFAPVNAAFADLPAGTVETLLEPENKGLLTKVLTAHVVAGDWSSAEIARMALVWTLTAACGKPSSQADGSCATDPMAASTKRSRCQ